ncbi:1,4-alpha-glucan branching protein GlgB [Lentisphaera marina]|uniref:1,4-alpha-glucan branching protein GlgB n=1 Tax=Lentisphaera marina TaxID=1111041 RepID=UPI002366398D|nr:1,4-alpha-glucan branching protein GlgB [Lentisphaera marina]MDD7983612.1 1,4-alpha-glucan branching protein GlgB [Lentisphaera marina]
MISPEQQNAICELHHESPHSYLGLHQHGSKWIVRNYEPYAEKLSITSSGKTYDSTKHENGFFTTTLTKKPNSPYQINTQYPNSDKLTKYDAYSFLPTLGDLDVHLMHEGNHLELYKVLGSQATTSNNIPGISFKVWAPDARGVSLIGNFNGWNRAINPMRKLIGSNGIWEIFMPEMSLGEYYKFAIKTQSGEIIEKQDPLGKLSELRPGTASVVWDNSAITWSDDQWLKQRENTDPLNSPLSIYEVHLGSWNHPDLKREGEFANYRDIAHTLGQYIKEMGYTHIELLPITEFPYDPSWGYQATGYFAPSSRFGTPADFAYFVNHLHELNIGVLIDWVPAHFPTDRHALGQFDGSSLYEHDNPDEGYHPDWNTFIFNFGRTEVSNFLISSALYWLKEFHIDGLRVDAVASMLYRDYSRKEGEWRTNKDGGRENYEAIEFLKRLNTLAHEHCPGTMVIAEESTAFPKVSRPTYDGGLGFTMKWNMGWMHDTLAYFSTEPIHRKYHQNQLTFSLVYAFNENFVLPLSHDEVVHGKGSLIQKMPGDTWQKFANLRCLYAYMYAHPGKKIFFMGSEIAQWHEWSESKSLDWATLNNGDHLGIQKISKKLNHIYQNESCFWENDFSHEGFEWIDAQDSEQSVLSFIRKNSKNEQILCIMNLTPVPRDHYTIGVPHPGSYKVLLNTDDCDYGGSDYLSQSLYSSSPNSAHNKDNSISINLPPLSVLYLKLSD